MILQALYEHYQRLLDDPETGVAPPGYSPAKVSHAIVLNTEGEVVDILTLATVQGRRQIAKVLLVPEQVKRASGVAANILCDGPAYVLGLERDKQGNISMAQKKYKAFKLKNEAFLDRIQTEGAVAIRLFLQEWQPAKALEHPVIAARAEELLAGSNLVFRLDSGRGYIHEQPEMRTAWESLSAQETEEVAGQCLITGGVAPIARLHPAIKGVVGAQTSGAPFVSFNKPSFTSYRKTQSFNAPVSTAAAFAYGTALNYLIASDTNRLRIADTTMVFWADKAGGRKEEAILIWSLDPVEPAEKEEQESRRLDPEAVRQAKTVLERARAGLPVGDAAAEFDADTRCYLLGLAPNAARLSVRFWQVSQFGDILVKIARHHNDMEIVGMERIGGVISLWRVLKALAVQGETKNIPPLLGGQFLKAVLTGQPYPQLLYTSALSRCRTGGDNGGVTTIRAAVIKAFLTRKYRIQQQEEEEALLTVSLNEENTNPGYLLGRLFSILEKVQKDALGNLNATIRDRYFGAASATPGSVFPLLLRLSRHHIAKAEYGYNADRKIQEVLNRLTGFPSHLNMEEQGKFILGYYHQNQANYEKNETKQEAAKQ